jgi:hypothetical protein
VPDENIWILKARATIEKARTNIPGDDGHTTRRDTGRWYMEQALSAFDRRNFPGVIENLAHACERLAGFSAKT